MGDKELIQMSIDLAGRAEVAYEWWVTRAATLGNMSPYMARRAFGASINLTLANLMTAKFKRGTHVVK